VKLLIAGGGTGGHVIPALAIAGALKSAYAAEVCFIGTSRGMETRLVPQAGYALELIDVGQLNRVSLATKLKTLVALPRGILHCLGLLRRWKPQVVVGVGGYASGPAMLAALILRVKESLGGRERLAPNSAKGSLATSNLSVGATRYSIPVAQLSFKQPALIQLNGSQSRPVPAGSLWQRG